MKGSFAIILIVWCAACSSTASGGTESTNPADADAPAKCDAFRYEYCKRRLQCLTDAGEIAKERTEEGISVCQSDLEESLSCSQVVAVSGSYDTCMSEVPKIECELIVQAYNGTKTSFLPTSCHGVLKE